MNQQTIQIEEFFMIGIIAATSINGIIGIVENGIGKLPFHYPDDMKHFKEMTQDSIVIMGRKTYLSMGRLLSKRTNIIISSQNLNILNAYVYPSINIALKEIKLNKNIWFIGGFSIYQEAMLYADKICLTLTPDFIPENIPNTSVVRFPFINPAIFELCGYSQITNSPSPKLLCAVYKRNVQNNYYNTVINQIIK
jgi:dihydrofolate reductase